MKLITKITLKSISLLILFCAVFIACDEEFASIDSDIINENNATNFQSISETYDVISYTDVLGPVQTNGLNTNMLGIYYDPAYGKTTASIVTQVSSSLVDPTFGDNVVLDSVVLTIPYFSTNLGLGEDDTIDYQLQSILPESEDDVYAPIKLSIFENTYFLRDFDPNEEFDATQNYFSNQRLSNSELIATSDLENTLIYSINELEISDSGITLTDNDPDEETVTQSLAPSIRLAFRDDVAEDLPVLNYWKEKILDQEGNAVLSNSANFNDYFRGLYFKAEPAVNDSGISDQGSLIILNLAQAGANVTLYYTSDSETTEGDRDQGTYVLTFGTNRINFFENDFQMPIPQGSETESDPRLYIKGGEGSVASISLFNGENVDDDDSTDNIFETFRNQFINLDADGEFDSYKRLINEVNLVFYVDQTLVMDGEEPDRLYLYNKTNGTPLLDYFQDTQNSTFPEISIPNHLGILERVDNEADGDGIKYTMKITSHITNILENNADNVELGLAVSGNVNLEGVILPFDVLTPDDTEASVPSSSLITPRGTVLHGNASTDDDKRLYLEIIYSCLKADENCETN